MLEKALNLSETLQEQLNTCHSWLALTDNQLTTNMTKRKEMPKFLLDKHSDMARLREQVESIQK